MLNAGTFVADLTYASCDETVTVAEPMLNSRRAFRAQSQLVSAIRCAGRAYAVGHQEMQDVPWPLLQAAYGRIMVPIPEGHIARSRISRLDAGKEGDTIYVGIEDVDTETLGSKFVTRFSTKPAAVDGLPALAELPNLTWQQTNFSQDTPISWSDPDDDGIETLAVFASRHSIDCARDFDTQLGIDVGEWGKGGADGRRHVALDLRIDRLLAWPAQAQTPLFAYRSANMLEPDSGSHLYQYLVASAEAQSFFCRITIHLVRIGPRDDAKRPWGTITAFGQPTKPKDVSAIFSYPSMDFVPSTA